MIKTLRMAIATALLLAAGNVAALGLGQIEVKSRLNQPLLAEIPIISTVPGELEALQARLASPETFRRIGLAPPSGLAANLQFSLGSDARGRPVIRVTTSAPVNQAVLNFLIEVDWGQGRLVREYSALVDAPRTASAVVQPAISAPTVAAPNVVQRPAPVQPVVPTVVAPVPAVVVPPAPERAPAVAPAPEPAPRSTAIEPLPPLMPAPIPARPAPVAQAVPTPVAAPPPQAVPAAPAPASAQYGPVKRGETLSKIASALPVRSGYTLDQTMLALLRANPDAFLGEDVNQLKQGTVLRIPASSQVGEIGADEAALVVREQMTQWRQARRAVSQPEAASRGVTRSAAVTPPATSAAPATPASQPIRAPTSTVRRQAAQARLAIVPPAVPGTATGTRSGTSAGGEGTMLQQQLRQRDEDLAARTAEIGELKDRVAELENLRAQQQQLLALKDSELAAAQQRLAEVRTSGEAAAAALPAIAPPPAAGQALATAQAADPAGPATTSIASPWLWGSLALLGLALLAWLLRRRSPRSTARPRRSFDSNALAASLVTAQREGVATGPSTTSDTATTQADVNLAEPLDAPLHPASEVVIDLDQAPSTPAPRLETPAWHSGRWVKAVPDSPSAPVVPAEPRFVVPAEPAPQASGAQRLKLAVAFMDIGDDESAQQLLRELLDDADPAARSEAARLLRELG